MDISGGGARPAIASNPLCPNKAYTLNQPALL
jgi:hypothetical protein